MTSAVGIVVATEIGKYRGICLSDEYDDNTFDNSEKCVK